MATLDECLAYQKEKGILRAPTSGRSSSSSTATASAKHGANTPAAATASTGTPATVQIALQNNTTATNLYAYVTGLDTNQNNAVWMLMSDGVSYYYPANPSSDQQPLDTDVAIIVGAPGSVRTVTIPHLVGGRIWFSENSPLTFRLNHGVNGPGLVEPSVTNTNDPNYKLRWDFCEFTYDTTQLFVNITYVDFVSIPVALQLETTDGSATQIVKGLPTDGLDTICNALQQQQRVDCAGWDQLVVQIKSTAAGVSFLRALSPYNAMVINSSLFKNYFDPYVAQVWSKYQSTTMTVDTQSGWGTVAGTVDSSTGLLTFSGIGGFPQPSTSDIFSCNTGAFAAYSTNTDEMGNLTARLAAALNRSTLLAYTDQPNGIASPSAYYQTTITNHYSRIVHSANLDGRGYAFPYDDVTPTNGADQSGIVASGYPSRLTVYIGGGNASGTASSSNSARSTPIRVREMARPGRQLVGGRRQHYRRSLPSPPPGYADHSEASAQEVVAMLPTMTPFLSSEAAIDADEKTLLQVQERAMLDPEKRAMDDMERGQAGPGSVSTKSDLSKFPSSTPDLSTRFALLLHQALLHLWAAICSVGRSVWAVVPRPVAAPVGAFCTRVAGSPAVTAMASSISSLTASIAKSAAASAVAALVIRPLVVRALLAGALLVVTYTVTVGGSAGASPMLVSALGTVSEWLSGMAGAQQTGLLTE